MMTVHLVKLSVGTESVEGFEQWVKSRVARNKKLGIGKLHDHVTRMHPRRETEVLDGGSIYWVIKGVILCRQKIADIKRVRGTDGIERSALLMEPPVIRTQPQLRRAFQGWRYFPVDDAPADLNDDGCNKVPPALHRELAALGLL